MRGSGNNGRGSLAAAALRCQPDSRLVRLMREGQDGAFAEIVRRYRAPLVAYAGGIVPDHQAEDVVQEALTRAHSALGQSAAEMNLRPWLFTIVRNGALNALRNQAVHMHLDENYDGVPQPPEVAARREELAALMAAVKALPEPQREALVKRELEGRSHEQIAAALGLSAGAVRGLIYRARATLRDAAGMLIPLPILRALLSSGSAGPEATGAAQAAAAGLAGGGGGIALKAGATLGVAVIAVGSGIAVQQRDGGSATDPAPGASPSAGGRSHGADASGHARLADAALLRGEGGGNEGEGSETSGPGGGRDGSSGSSSGPGSGGRSASGTSSGTGPGTGGRGDGGGGSATLDGRDGGGSSSSGDGGGTSGSDDGGGGSGTDGGGSSGSGSDGGGDVAATSGSGGDDGSSGSGSGDGGGTTTTTTTTTDGTNGGGSSGGD